MLRVMGQDGLVARAVTPVITTAVSGRVRAVGSRPPDTESLVEAADDVLSMPTPPRWLVVTWVAAAVVLSVVLDDVRWGIAAAGALAGAIVLYRLSQRATFTFGEGFVPYRSDLGWPHGVQEDDDVHWSWSNGRRSS